MMKLPISTMVILLLAFSSAVKGTCKVEKISFNSSKFIIDYELHLRNQQNCSKDYRWKMTLKPCIDSRYEEIISKIERKGSFCPSLVGCLTMKVGKAVSEEFNSTGDEMHLDVSFSEYSITEVKLALKSAHASLVANWDLRIFKCKKVTNGSCLDYQPEKEFTSIGNGTFLQAHYTFQADFCYYFDLYPKVSNPQCRLFRTQKFTDKRGCQPWIANVLGPSKEISWVERNWWILVAFVPIILAFCIGTLIAIKCPTRAFAIVSVTDSETSLLPRGPETDQKREVSVLLLYAEEGNEFLKKVESLSKELEQYANAEILKISDMQDPIKASDPNFWLMDKLDAKSGTRVLIIWSPIMKFLSDSLFTGILNIDGSNFLNEAISKAYCQLDTCNLKPSFRVEYLKAAVRRILAQDSAPAYVIRFQEDIEANEQESQIMLGKREFILPRDWKYLHSVLVT